LVEEVLPTAVDKGRRRSDLRQVLKGVFWILRTGAPWRDLPERYGPWQTVYPWFNLWRQDGTWDRMLEQLQIRLDGEGRIDGDLWCVDGSSIRASRAAAGTGKIRQGRLSAAQHHRTLHWVTQGMSPAGHTLRKTGGELPGYDQGGDP
jgi:transposase